MVRDTRRNKNYFDEAIADTDDSISRYMQRLQQAEKLSPAGRMGGAAGLCRLILSRLEYCYSRGDALTSKNQDLVNLLTYRNLQQTYADALPEEDIDKKVEWEKLDFLTYKQTLTWLAFAVSMDADHGYIKNLMQLIGNSGLDCIFDRIAVNLGDNERPIASKVLHVKPYGLLLDAINATPDQQTSLMNKFMDAWYPACTKNGFYDTHNITNNFGYRGYWCFEAALITMIFKLDDNGYKNHQYYPAALVHSG